MLWSTYGEYSAFFCSLIFLNPQRFTMLRFFIVVAFKNTPFFCPLKIFCQNISSRKDSHSFSEDSVVIWALLPGDMISRQYELLGPAFSWLARWLWLVLSHWLLVRHRGTHFFVSQRWSLETVNCREMISKVLQPRKAQASFSLGLGLRLMRNISFPSWNSLFLCLS